MNLAEPPRRVSPATAEMAQAAKAVEHDDEYKVQTAENFDGLNVKPAEEVDAAVMVDDPRKFAPTHLLEKPRTNQNDHKNLPVSKLKESETGIAFESPAGVTNGVIITAVRKCTLVLSKILPALYDERDFVSLGEIMRYVVLKDNVLFVYTQKDDPTYLYSLPLESLKVVLENPKKPHKRSMTVSPGYGMGIDRQDDNIKNVLLLDVRDKLIKQIVFDCKEDKDQGLADRFVACVQGIIDVEKVRDTITSGGDHSDKKNDSGGKK